MPWLMTMPVEEGAMIEAGVGFSGALADAYRRAVRHGLPLVGTDLVLWSR